MMEVVKPLQAALEKQDKADAIALTRRFLEAGNLVSFYEEVIPSILNSIECVDGDYRCVFHEHRKSMMVRSLVEISYPYVKKHQKTLKKEALVMIACLKYETHELGAVIGSYLFEYYGFKTVLTGADTPLETLLAGLEDFPTDYLVLSVTNAYNLSEFNKVLSMIRLKHPTLKIFGAGRGAIKHQLQLDIDGIISTSSEIEALIKGEGL